MIIKHFGNFIIDSIRKPKILEKALENGCDVDGDIVIYKGVVYFVYIYTGYIRRSYQVKNK